MNSRNRILLIHYYYPPLQSAGVLRNYFFSLEFAKMFKEVLVVSSANSDKLPQEMMPTLSNIIVEKACTIDYRTIAAARSTKSTNIHLAENRKESRLYNFFSKMQKTLPFHFIVGEGSLAYIVSAFRKGRNIINRGGVNVIYSSFGPYADHLVAYFLKRKFPEIKWIADFRDLQIEPLYNNVYLRKWQSLIEKKLLQKADIVTTVSEGLAKQLEKYGRTTLAVPRGVELRTKDYEMYTKFTICYTGSLYRHFRDANCFFKAIAELIYTRQIPQEEVQFLYAGRDSTQFRRWVDQYQLQGIYRDLGILTKAETWEVQNRSHLQLLLTTSTTGWSGVLTGKLFEYLESGNGIIVLIKGVRDMEFEHIMENTGAGKVFYDPPAEKSALDQYLLDQYKYWKETGEIEMRINKKYITSKMSWGYQAEKMLTGIGI